MIDNLYSTGKFGIVDPYYRHIWLNIDNESIAHKIRLVFWCKTPSIIFDLSQFDNYADNIVDSEVSLDWKIETCDYNSFLLSASTSCEQFKKTQTHYSSKKLINEPNHSPLPRELQIELQYQMLIYYIILLYIVNRNCIDISNNHVINKIDKIFQSNISTDSICTELYQLALDFDNLLISSIILQLLNRSYE